MKNEPTHSFIEQFLSRRRLLRGVVLLTSGGAVLIGASQPAEALIPQKAAGYQTKPNKGQACATCDHFKAPSSCNIVAGQISPQGWCRLYVKKT